jgi:hypothetical protein
MRFTRCVHPITGQICLYIDLEGLDIYGNATPEERRSAAEFLYFRISTYELLKPKVPNELFEDIIRPVNKVFSILDERALKILAVMYIDLHMLVLDRLSDQDSVQNLISEVTDHISEYLIRIDEMINLHNAIKTVVDTDIVVPDFTNLGNRPQDSEEKTFSTQEVKIVSEIAVLCKLMAPILGVLIETCKKKVNTHIKELYVVSALKGFINKYYEKIIMKLKDYVSDAISSNYSDNLSYTFNGMSVGIVHEVTFAALLVRRFVGVNLYQENCNLMTYIITFVRSSTANIGGNKSTVECITKPSDMSVGDEGNTSMLEAESMRSIATADLPILIELAANQTIPVFMDLYGLSDEEYEKALKYYHINHCGMNPVSVYLLTLVFGKSLGGAYNVNLLTFENASRLLVVLQLLLIKLGVYDIVPLVTAKRSVTAKETMSPIDNMIIANWKDTNEFAQLNRRFPYMIDGIAWYTGLKSIVTYITGNILLVNTAPNLLEMMQIDSSYNGMVFRYDDGIITSICRLILMFTSTYVGNVQSEV